MEERDLNCSEEKSYYPIMADFATKVTKIPKLEGVGIENPYKYLTYRDFLRRVPGGTRTHDIQNHNLTL